jgi:WD40 repeat protein
VLGVRAAHAASLAQRKADEADGERQRADDEARDARRLAGEAKEAGEKARRNEEKALEKEKQARENLIQAEGLRLTVQSELVRPTNPGQALLLAIEGARRHRSLHASNALLAALDACHEQRALIGHTKPVVNAAWSPDGRRILTWSSDGTARIWDADTGRQLHVLSGHAPYLVHACWSPEGTRVLTVASAIFRSPSGGTSEAGGRGIDRVTFQTWNVATGRRLATWKAPGLTNGRGYHNPLLATAFSPDGRRVLTAACVLPGWPTVHDAETGEELAALKGHQAPSGAAAWSPDGRLLVTAALDGTACVWDAATYRLLWTYRDHQDAIGLVRFSPDGKRVLTVGDGRVHVFKKQGNRVVDDDSKELAPTSGRVWDVESGGGKMLRWPKDYWIPIQTAAWSPDGRWIVTGGNGPSLVGSKPLGGGGLAEFPLVWDAATGELALILAPPSGWKGYVAGCYNAVFSPDGHWIVTADRGRVARLWDLRRRIAVVEWSTPGPGRRDFELKNLKGPTGQLRTAALYAEFLGHEGDVYSAAFSPDGRRVVTASGDGTPRVWDADLGTEPHHGADARRPRQGRWPLFGFAIAASRDGRRIALTEWDGRHEVVRVWDGATGKMVAELHDSLFGVSVVFGADNNTLVTTLRGTTRIWDLQTGKVRHELKHQNRVGFVEVSPDGRLVLTVEEGEEANVWDAATGRKRCRLARKVRPPDSWYEGFRTAAFSGDSRRIALVQWDNSPPCVFDAASGKVLCSPSPGKRGQSRYWGNTVCLSRDGARLLATASERAWVWDGTDGRLVFEQKATEGSSFAGGAISPDGNLIALCSQDGTVRIWEARTSKPVAVVRGHDRWVDGAAFNRDGTLLVTASQDGTARVWDTSTGRELLTLKHDSAVLRAVFTRDGRQVFTVSRGFARLWPLDPLAAAEQRKPRDLTAAERERFLIGATGRR